MYIDIYNELTLNKDYKFDSFDELLVKINVSLFQNYISKILAGSSNAHKNFYFVSYIIN